MALKVKNGSVPENAVILTPSEAISYQWNQIMEWKPQSEVWPYTHGLAFLGSVAAVSGMVINLKFRKTMKIHNIGGILTLVTTSLCPGAMASLLQMKYVSEKTFLPIKTCPLCLEMRSVAVQNATAIAYPMILVPITNFMIVLRAQTHRIPYYKNWRDLLFFCRQIYKPILPTLALIAVANSLAASFILYKQYNCMSYMYEVQSLENEPDPNTDELKDIF